MSNWIGYYTFVSLLIIFHLSLVLLWLILILGIRYLFQTNISHIGYNSTCLHILMNNLPNNLLNNTVRIWKYVFAK